MSIEQTEKMVCTLREVVIAQYAANRAWAEFYQSIGGVSSAEEGARIRAAVIRWIDGDDVDPRSIDVADLADILKHI